MQCLVRQKMCVMYADVYCGNNRTVMLVYTGWAKKTGPFLRVHNFATDGARNACDMSKFSKFYLEKNIELACQCV